MGEEVIKFIWDFRFYIFKYLDDNSNVLMIIFVENVLLIYKKIKVKKLLFIFLNEGGFILYCIMWFWIGLK